MSRYLELEKNWKEQYYGGGGVPNRDNSTEKKDLYVLVLVIGTKSLRGWPQR